VSARCSESVRSDMSAFSRVPASYTGMNSIVQRKGNRMFSNTRKVTSVFLFVVLLTAVRVWGAESGVPAATPEHNLSATEINKKLTNPVSELWSITLQQNNYVLTIAGKGSSHWTSSLQLQPVLPVSLTSDWNLITRPVLPLFTSNPYPVSVPHPVPHTDIRRSTAFGDTILLEMLSPSPKLAGNWLLGVGPTFIFPTASDVHNGQGKWQVGPAAIVGYLSKKWMLAAFMQDWISFAGQHNRDSVHQMNLQPVASYFLPDGWGIGYSGNVLANWRAERSTDVWTVPVGISVSKVVKLGKLPVRIALAGQYMPIHPNNFGQKWNIQLVLAPVIPKLIKGNLFGD